MPGPPVPSPPLSPPSVTSALKGTRDTGRGSGAGAGDGTWAFPTRSSALLALCASAPALQGNHGVCGRREGDSVSGTGSRD